MTRLRVLQPLNVVLAAPEGTALVALEPGEFVSLDDVESEFWTRNKWARLTMRERLKRIWRRYTDRDAASSSRPSQASSAREQGSKNRIPVCLEGYCMSTSPKPKPLTWKDLEELRSKAQALDEAVEWMTGRIDSEKLMTVYGILTRRK